MNIVGTEYNLNHKALEIYLSGCDGACLCCHNKELWDFNVGEYCGREVENSIIKKCNTNLVEQIWILGGEPLLQNISDLRLFLKHLNYWIFEPQKPIMLWTRFYEKDIPNNIKQYLSYTKVGEYQKDSEAYIEPLFGIKLASKNQRIIKL